MGLFDSVGVGILVLSLGLMVFAGILALFGKKR